ncbi:MAG: hypothetical protein ACI4TB_05485 [Lachnospiraceae bacterium]
MKKRTLYLISIIWILFLSTVFTGCTNSSKGDKASNLRQYNILELSETADTSASAKLLTQLADNRLSINLKTTPKESAKQIILLDDEATANTYGQSLSGLPSCGFQIINHEGTLLLLSPTEAGLKRACSFLIWRFVEEDGSLSLSEGEFYADMGKNIKDAIYIGETPLSDYSIVYTDKKALLPVAQEFAFYIQQTSMDILPVISSSDAEDAAHTICISLDSSLSAGEYRIAIQEGAVSIIGSDASAARDCMYLFLDTYMGWIKTGTEEAHISSTANVLHIPFTLNEKTPWIAEREAIITLWNINYSRGVFLNNSTSLKNNIMSFSEDQLYEYVKMLKFCGFTGIQVTDMCSAWAGVGGYENVHDKIRILADAAHSLDMHFTLWVWGSEFTGYGWVDDSVTYSFEGYHYAYENPAVVETFEKYYSIYAELADCCDRVIVHYYDPGNLEKSEDIAFFAKMLRDKFIAVNPDIDFGVSCWVDIFDKNVLVEELGNDITLYESGHHDNVDDYVSFRNTTSSLGCRLGTWAWNTCEMEIDQMAQMNFNLDIIQSTYQTARNYDSIMKSSYWSEMDSYHVLNVFSLYCAGQLLIDPDMDSDTLLRQVAWQAVGDEYAEDFAQILSLIQDARSGSSWDTYWWNSENYILKSDDYPAEDILERCNTYIPILQEMIDKGIESNTLPLPISLNEVLQMMLPHLEQIRSFAEFRIEFAKLEDSYEQGASSEALAEALNAISTPIHEYNCIIGLWGQVESRAQQEMIRDFCNRANLPVPTDATYEMNCKFRIYSYFITVQKGKAEPVYLYFPYFQYGLAYGADETYAMVLEMAEEGILTMNEDKNGAFLTDWENYIYQFN